MFPFPFFKKKEKPVVEIISGGRASGRTTRIVDKLIQDFFNNGACYVYDHHASQNARNNVAHILLLRLESEHGISRNQIKIDKKNNIITYERNTRA